MTFGGEDESSELHHYRGAVSRLEKRFNFTFMDTKHTRKLTDAATLPLYGKATDETPTRYSRLPASFRDISRKPVWKLGQNSAGEYIRFRTDSPTIWVRWVSKTSL